MIHLKQNEQLITLFCKITSNYAYYPVTFIHKMFLKIV